MKNTANVKLPPMVSKMRAGIVGMSGTGKGNCAKAWLAREQKRGTRIVMFDPDDEYSVLGLDRPGEVILGTLTQRVRARDFVLDPGAYLDGPKLALAVVPEDDADVAAEQCADVVEHCRATGNMLVGFDEIGGFAFGNKNAAVAMKALDLVATKARKQGIAGLFISQRLTHIPYTARSQINALEIFNQQATADLAALEELTGRKDLGPEVKAHKAGESSLWVNPLLADSLKAA